VTAIPVSIVVVSRGRPAALARCLTGLSQLLYPCFEIIVVADPSGIAAVSDWGTRIKRVPFDQANISAARNAGLTQAAGDVVAFVDDDAVPEPTWISHLIAPFALPEVIAAGGRVLGRNGITPQWPDRDVRPDATSHLIVTDPVQPTLLTGCPGLGIKTEGTNMAFRAADIRAIGGFDPAYRFYLDETDLNLRLAAKGTTTALVPQAVVHHGFAASARRREDRVPLTLHEVGASLAVFARRHGVARPLDLLAREERDRRVGLIAHMVAGRAEPRDVRRTLASLRQGWDDGAERALGALPPVAEPASAFLPFAPLVPDRGARVLAGSRRESAALRSEAARLTREGWRISLFLLEPGPRRHIVQYDPDGFWVQSGGVKGRTVRTAPAPRTAGMAGRVAMECDRLASVRALNGVDSLAPGGQ
jgi:O-antigen biosynthesis protein